MTGKHVTSNYEVYGGSCVPACTPILRFFYLVLFWILGCFFCFCVFIGGVFCVFVVVSFVFVVAFLLVGFCCCCFSVKEDANLSILDFESYICVLFKYVEMATCEL